MSPTTQVPPLESAHPGRATHLCELISLMMALATPPSAPAPQPPKLDGDPAGLAKAAATSAERIAGAIAALGLPGQDDQACADTLWSETVRQIERIQKLHGLPPMSFQQKPLPPAYGSLPVS